MCAKSRAVVRDAVGSKMVPQLTSLLQDTGWWGKQQQ
jgi:hypothetical protein